MVPQFEDHASDHKTSWRSDGTAMPTSGHTTATNAMTSKLAGISRRARDARKRRRSKSLLASSSLSSFHVISQPETTKNASTPRIPPAR